jgi:hypothetical protein
VTSILAIVFLPLLAAIVGGLGNRTLGNTVVKVLTTGALFVSCALSWPIFLAFLSGSAEATVVPVLHWVTSGDMSFDWALRVDTLTAVMLVVITTVSALVHLYSWGYMEEDPDQPRFFAYLSLFTFAMLMLVTADNLVQMFFGWEGVGLASYLLIGFWFKSRAPMPPRSRPSWSTAWATFGFMLGIFGTFLVFGTVSIPEILEAAPSMAGSTIQLPRLPRRHHDDQLCLLLFIGAMGKSAQLGLHTWLPDAMEGPTPVSALIHAATMVTAGVFMVCRLSPMFEAAPIALGFRHLVGAATALLRRDHRHDAVGHQAGDRLFDLLAARLHVLRGGRGRLRRGDVPPVHARLLQGAAVPRRGLGHPRHAPRTGHAILRRTAQRDPLHLLGDDDRARWRSPASAFWAYSALRASIRRMRSWRSPLPAAARSAASPSGRASVRRC